MKAIFETEFGKITLERTPGRGDASGVAYFQADDFESEIAPNGEFQDAWGRQFTIHWPNCNPYHKEIGMAVLDALMPRVIGRAQVA